MNRYHHQRNSIQQGNNITDPPNVKRFSFPFVPTISKLITKTVTNKCDNVIFAYKNYNNVGKLYSKLKDPVPLHQATNVVYQINCIGGDNKCYIGSSNDLERRKKEHERSVLNNETNKSRLAYHSITKGHRFDFDNIRVLEREPNYRKRMLLEEIHIKSSRNCVNLRSLEAKNINDIYLPLLQKFGKR